LAAERQSENARLTGKAIEQPAYSGHLRDLAAELAQERKRNQLVARVAITPNTELRFTAPDYSYDFFSPA